MTGRSAVLVPDPPPTAAPLPLPLLERTAGVGSGSVSPVQTFSTTRSRHRCDSSAVAITSVVADGPDALDTTRDDQRGRAWLATREFETQPSTRAEISPGVTIIPVAPSCRSR